MDQQTLAMQKTLQDQKDAKSTDTTKIQGTGNYVRHVNPQGIQMRVRERKRIGTVAFWMKDDEIIENDASHIKVITDDPEKFGLTRDYIESVYEKYGEKIGTEGKAREEIIKEASRQGWIRVRHYVNKGGDYWSIQADNIRRRKRQINDFIFWALEQDYMTMNDELVILGYDDERVLRYGFMEGGVKAYMEERKKKCERRSDNEK